MIKPKFIGLFSGCGGFDLGFEQAGYECLAAFDNDPLAISVYNSNLRMTAKQGDLAATGSLKLRGRPDVVIAGPPCQGFSTLGRRDVNDPRNSLLIQAVKLGISAKPRVFILENVSGAISGAHRVHWTMAEQLLSDAGFQFRLFKVVATDFGLPQIRKRVILLAAKCSLANINPPSLKNAVGLRDFLNNAELSPNHAPRHLDSNSIDFKIALRIGPHQKLCNVRGGDRAVPTWSIPEVFGEVTDDEADLLKIIQRLRRRLRTREFGDADPLSMADFADHCDFSAHPVINRLVKKGYIRRIGKKVDLAHTFNGKYRRLAWDHPTPAVDTRFGEPRYFLHPEEQRGLSVREAARIQGFPDSFEFNGPRAGQYRLVGNAVPPPIARWFAEAIKDQLL